jgi:hypothetical protein
MSKFKFSKEAQISNEEGNFDIRSFFIDLKFASLPDRQGF